MQEEPNLWSFECKLSPSLLLPIVGQWAPANNQQQPSMSKPSMRKKTTKTHHNPHTRLYNLSAQFVPIIIRCNKQPQVIKRTPRSILRVLAAFPGFIHRIWYRVSSMDAAPGHISSFGAKDILSGAMTR